MDVVISLLDDSTVDLVDLNVARKLSTIQANLKDFVTSLSRHQRTAATHIWVIMISPETRQSKPYALPVQCIPYKSLTAVDAWLLINKVVSQMVERRMDVAGKQLFNLWIL